MSNTNAATRVRKKITWNMIFTDFKKLHPNLRKLVVYWCPYDLATILLHLKDGKKITYNYETKNVRFL